MRSGLKEKLSDDLITALKERKVPTAPEAATRLTFPRSAAFEVGPEIKVSINGRGDIYADATIECGWRDMPLYEISTTVPMTLEHALSASTIEGIVDALVDERQKRIAEQAKGVYRQEYNASCLSVPFKNVTRDDDDGRIWYPQIWASPCSHLTQKIVLPEPLEAEPQCRAAKDIKSRYSQYALNCECPILPLLGEIILAADIFPRFYACYSLRIEVPQNPSELISVTIQSRQSIGVYSDIFTIRVVPYKHESEPRRDLLEDSLDLDAENDDDDLENWLF